MPKQSSSCSILSGGFKDSKSAAEAAAMTGKGKSVASDLSPLFEAAVIDENAVPPPHIPVNTLQAIGTSHCKIPLGVVSDEVLNYDSSNDK